MKHAFRTCIGIPFLIMALVLPFAPGVVTASPAPPQWSNWSAPVSLGPPVNTSAQESCQVVTKDGMSLYFGSNRTGTSGNYDLWVSHRKSADQPWGDPQNLGPAINTGYNDRCPYVTPDGHSLIFVSDRPGGQGFGDFYISYRHNQNDDLGWGPPRNIAEINTPVDVYAMWGFEEQGLLKLYFGQKPDNVGTTPGDIYSTTMGKKSTFSLPEPVSELNTADHESFPVVRKDGLEIFFNSNRPGGSGGSDLWVATRQATSDPWSAAVNLGPVVNSPADESRAALSWDGTTITFASTRPGGLGGYDIYTATRCEQKYTFTMIDIPDAKWGCAFDISPNGDVVGNYQSKNNAWHGFVIRDGQFVALDYPGVQTTMIRPGGIAPSGDIAGFYVSGGIYHGFLLTRNGEWSTVDYPGQPNTVWTRILPDGTLIGNHFPVGGGDTGDMRAIVMGRHENDELDMPCTVHIGGTPDGKVLVGYYRADPYTGPFRPYVFDNGVFISFVVPGSGFYCAAWDISPDGNTIVGTYLDTAGKGHGFVAERHGASVDDWDFTTIDVPDAASTTVNGCNPAGDLVGRYKDGYGVERPFLASRSGGK